MDVLERPLVLVGIILAAVLVLAGWLLVSYRSEVGFAAAIVLMVAGGALSRFPQRFSGDALGIELCTLFTVVSVFAFGVGWGIAIGAVGMALSGAFTKERPDETAVAVVGIMIVALLAGMLMNLPLLWVGMICTLVYDAFTSTVYLLTGHTWVGCARFALTHIVWNFVMFRAAAGWLLLFL